MNNESNREILEIRVEDIIPNRFQPRLTFDMEALNELANSIKEHGIIQPLVVRRLQDKYEIIAGERRYKAATLIGLSKVPCIVMNLNDNESAEVAVIENIQRKEMTPLEEAKSWAKAKKGSNLVTVVGDATVLFPLIVAGALDKIK